MRLTAWVALAGVALALLLLRPVSPFEWDEVLYQRALDGYDVARHAPHPPGAPLLIWVADALRLVVGDPQVALQLVAVGCALAALLLLVALARREHVSGASAWGGAALLATVPAFLFYANVGLSDVPATTGLLASVLACLLAVDDPRRLPVAAAVVAAALGVRPQLVPALLPVGLAAIASAVRRRAGRPLLLALGAGVAVSVAIWLPAALLTGVDRYRQAFADHARYWIEVERQVRLPGAPVGKACLRWLVVPLGTPLLAGGFWGLTVVGAIAWWRRGRRRLVFAAGSTASAYLLSAAFAMNLDASVRYVLPTLAFAALLAGGVTAVGSRRLRVAGVVVLLLWGAAALHWGGPALRLRRSPAPVWAALGWVAQHEDPVRTKVVVGGVLRPHAQYVLGRAGFVVEVAEGDRVYAGELRPDGDVLLVTPRPVPGAEVLFERVWPSPELRQLTMGRYDRCVVQRVPSGDGPRFSPAFHSEDRGTVLWGAGRIELGGGRPMTGRVCPLTVPVTLDCPGASALRVPPGTCADVILAPGPEGAIRVRAPERVHALLRPLTFRPRS